MSGQIYTSMCTELPEIRKLLSTGLLTAAAKMLRNMVEANISDKEKVLLYKWILKGYYKYWQ